MCSAVQVCTQNGYVHTSCRLRGGSGEEAEKAGEIARALGAEHHIVALDWEKAGGSNRTASRARAMRYSTLIQQCQKVNVDMLMVGHHANDQIGMH